MFPVPMLRMRLIQIFAFFVMFESFISYQLLPRLTLQRKLATFMRKLDPAEFKYESNKYVLSTKLWLKNWVLKNGFCPWAEAVYSSNCIRYVVLSRNSSTISGLLHIHEDAMQEIQLLGERNLTTTTTLLIIPALTSFSKFMDFAHMLNCAIEDNEYLADTIQVASFHPNYVFDGKVEDDADNFTNRSPYPILHLLRIDDVSEAIESVGGDTDFIWKRNMALLNRKGIEWTRFAFSQVSMGT